VGNDSAVAATGSVGGTGAAAVGRPATAVGRGVVNGGGSSTTTRAGPAASGSSLAAAIVALETTDVGSPPPDAAEDDDTPCTGTGVTTSKMGSNPCASSANAARSPLTVATGSALRRAPSTRTAKLTLADVITCTWLGPKPAVWVMRSLRALVCHAWPGAAPPPAASDSCHAAVTHPAKPGYASISLVKTPSGPRAAAGDVSALLQPLLAAARAPTSGE